MKSLHYIKNLKELKDSIQSKKFFKSTRLALRMPFSCYSHLPPNENEEVNIIADLLASGSYPVNVPLYVCCNDLSAIEPILHALISGKCPNHIKIEFADKFLTDHKFLVAMATVLNHPHCPSNLQMTLFLDWSSTAATFLKMLEQNYPTNLYLSLHVEHKLAAKFVSVFVAKLKKAHFSQGSQFDLSSNYFGFDEVEAIKNAMLSNTQVVKLKLGECRMLPDWSGTEVYSKKPYAQEQVDIINYCCLRNKLILKYPEFSNFIKRFSFEYGLYLPKAQSMPSSLKNLTASFLIFNPVHIKYARLPSELKAYLNKLKEVRNCLACEHKKIAYSGRPC